MREEFVMSFETEEYQLFSRNICSRIERILVGQYKTSELGPINAEV